LGFRRKSDYKEQSFIREKCLKILALFILFNLSNAIAQRGFEARKFLVLGSVFFDKNQNGIKEANEHGISGVRVFLNDGTKDLSTPEGKFELESNFFGKFVEVILDEDSVPPGSMFTTPTKDFVNLNVGAMRIINFGVYYPVSEKKFYIEEPEFEDRNYFVTPSYYKIKIDLIKNTLFINNKSIKKLSVSSSKAQASRRKFNILFNEITMSIQRDNLSNLEGFIREYKQEFDRVEVHIYLPEKGNDTQKKQTKKILTNEVSLLLKENNINKSSVDYQYYKGDQKAEVYFLSNKDMQKTQCIVHYDGPEDRDIPLSFRRIELFHPVDRSGRLEIKCPNERVDIDLPRFRISSTKKGKNDFEDFVDDKVLEWEFSVPKRSRVFLRNQELTNITYRESFVRLSERYEFIIQDELGIQYRYPVLVRKNKSKNKFQNRNKSQIILSYSKYINEARDRNVNFRVDGKKFRKIEVNGRTYTKKKTPTNYMFYPLDRGDQYLRLKLVDDEGREKYFKQDFTLFKDPTVKFELSFNNYMQKNNSKFNKFSYDFSSIQALGGKFDYFYSERTGIGINLFRDVSDVKVNKLPSGVDRSHNVDMKYYMSYRFWLDDYDFHSTKLVLSAGIQRRTFDATTQSTILVPRNFTGYYTSLDLVMEEFPVGWLDLLNKFEFSWDLQLRSNFNIRWEPQFHLHLNGLGDYFGIEPYYSFFYRYGSLQDFRLILSPYFDYVQRDIKTQTEGKINTLNLGIKAALLFNY
jgi:hypothetical protein